jgi:hypothetical protein
MNKFIIVFLFISTLFSQNVDGEFSLGEISFLIKNIHFEGGYKDRGRNEEFNNGIGSLDIGLIKYGFSNIDLSGDLNAYNNRAKVNISFPDLNLKCQILRLMFLLMRPMYGTYSKKS